MDGRYTIQDSLSDEGKLIRFNGIDLLSKEPVILNMFKPTFMQDSPERHHLFLENLEKLAKFERLNINPIMATNSDYFVVPKPPYPTLRESLAEGAPLSLPTAIKIAASIAETMTTAHAVDLIHFNLKPENVYLMADDEALLDNFQFLNPTTLPHGHHTPTTALNYTYMSPESCDITELDARVDIWALGIILFEMLTGRPPFYNENPLRLMLAIMRQPLPDIQALDGRIPNGVADLLYRMLTKDKHQRIPSMQLVLELLRHIEKQLTVEDTQAFPFQPHLVVRRATTLPLIGPVFGREKELETLSNLLLDSDERLVSLTGPGGMGKTHLAISLGHQLDEKFEHGVVYTDLEAVDDPDLAVATIATSLNFRTFGKEDARVQLQKFLNNKRLLLIFDNIAFPETIVPILKDLLDHTKIVKFLTTSYEPIEIESAVAVSLHGLPVVESFDNFRNCAACQMYVQAVRKQQYDYVPPPYDQEAIWEICQLVGGVPLAIELAGGQMSQLSAEEILIELSGSLSILDTNSATIPAKHRSIDTLYQQMWRSLSQEERETLKKLSVFVGGFPIEAIEEVTGARFAIINALVGKSLLHRSADEGFYYLQPLLRKMATDRLSANPAVKIDTSTKHSHFYLQTLAKQIDGLRGGQQLEALDYIDKSYGNLRRAAHWALAMYDLDLIGSWLEAMYLYFTMRGRQQEGFSIFTDIVRQIDLIFNDDPNIFSLKAQLRRLGLAHYVHHNLDLAQLLKNYLAIAREINNLDEIAFALTEMSAQPFSNEERMAYCIEAIDIGLKIDRQDLVAQAYNWLAFILFRKTLYVDALILLDQRIRKQRELGDYYGISMSLNNQGIVYNNNGELEKARELLLEAADLFEVFNNQVALALAYINLTQNAVLSRDIPRAHSFIQKAIKILEHVGDPADLAIAIQNKADIAILNDDLDKALEICREGLAMCEKNNLPNATYVFYRLMGRACLYQNNISEAKSYLLKAMDDDTNQKVQLEALADMAELFAQTKNIPLACQLSLYVQRTANSDKLKEQVDLIIDQCRREKPLTLAQSLFKSISECREQILAAD